jgi:UDP:flavonoid glycosyltransferase YjiC (YdhE family)
MPWVSQADVLAHAAAMLGHGGFGTTMGALAAGVPQVVAPLFSFDQVVNGRHVAAAGAGVTLEPRSVSAAAGQVALVLNDSSFAEHAKQVSADIAALRPTTEVVDVLCRLAG